MRFKHYSVRTKATYREWIRRYSLFHGMRLMQSAVQDVLGLPVGFLDP